MYQKNVLLRLTYLLVFLFPAFLQAQTADLELSMTSNNPQVGIYDYITITSTIQNIGTQGAENVIVKFDIPTGVAIAGEFPPNAEQGTYEGFFGGSTEGNWNIGNVPAGESLSFDVTFFTLSETPITFYGQVAAASGNDPDSTPDNGTCCTANEDDEAAYIFPNAGPGCTFDQAYAELTCDDNGTPNDQSDNTYTLRFRADGDLNGTFNLSIPTLGYNQTSAYSIGFTELTNLSLGTETLELIFTDEAGTENCGETLFVSGPPCGSFPPLCEIVYNEISNTIDDMGTPDNVFDDTFTIVYTIENSGGGTGFVGQFGGQFCGQVPSTGTYGEEITFTANLANWGNGSTVSCGIVDNENPDCTGGYSLLPEVECGFGNTCADLELRAANTPTPAIYQTANAQFIVENEFNGSNPADGTESGVQITFNKIGLNVVGVPTVSQGSIDLYWTDNPVWNVGELAPNETAIIDFELYTINANYTLFGEVSAQSLTDGDSTPNNGNGTTPQEDDEAVYTNSGDTQMTPDFTVSNLIIQNSPIAAGQVLNFSYDFTNQGNAPWASSSTTRYWISTDAILSADDLAGGATFSNVGIAAGETYNVPGGQSTVNVSLPDGDYFLIVQADELDVVLESDETNNTTAAPFTIGGGISCNLTITDTQITCADNTTNSPFVFAIEVAGAAGNTVDYEILGTSFGGTIIVGQLVDVATLPQGTDFTIVITEPDNVACDFALTSNIPVAPGVCGNGGSSADVTLDVSTGLNTPTEIYQAGEAIFTITNTGTSPATGLTVTFTKNQVNVTGTPTTTAGTSQFHWTDNPVWQVGTLAPGQSEFIVFPVFTVSETFGIYGEVTAMTENDVDSSPNNGNGNTPIEDDEALWPNDNTMSGLPDLVITNTSLTINSTEIGGTIDYSFTIENQGTAPNMSGFVYTGFVTDDSSISTPYSGQGTVLVTDILAPGQSIVRSGTFTINSNVPGGYNYFGIIVDGGGNIPESNEDNNAYLDGLFFFDEANNPCMIDLELVNINCTEAEGVYDLTIAMNAVNLFPINQTYTYLNGEFLGVAFTGDSDVRTFFDIPLDQVTNITTTDSASDCMDASLVVEVDPATDCDVVSQGVDLELTVSASTESTLIYSTYSVTYTLTNAGNAEATGIYVKSPRHPDVVFEGGNEFTTSQGTFDYLGATNSFWNVGSLAAGASATITMNFFTLDTGTITNWAFVIAQNEPDFDSTPEEWVCCVPGEDDEAGIIVNVPLSLIGDNTPELASPTPSLSVHAYPVPAESYLTVEISSTSREAANVEILDVNGRTQILRKTEAVKGLQTIEIPVDDLGKGIYLLSVRKGEETVIQRFVKM